MADRRAPVQGEHYGDFPHRPAGTVPWEVHERAWQQYAALGHGGQSAERIAERMGFGYDEMACLLAGHNPWGDSDPWPHDHPPVEGWEPRG